MAAILEDVVGMTSKTFVVLAGFGEIHPGPALGLSAAIRVTVLGSFWGSSIESVRIEGLRGCVRSLIHISLQP